MKPLHKAKLLDIGVASIAILVGAVVVYLGDMLLGVKLEYFYGVETFSPLWVLDLFVVPFIAGIIVSLIYGLGGKMAAHFSPLIVRISSYYLVTHSAAPLPEGVDVLPMPYWLLIMIVSAEFAAFGGVVGEIITKKTYGRTPKELLHIRYQQKISPETATKEIPSSQVHVVEGSKE